MNPADFAAANLSRATGAGLDPHEYLRITAALTSLEEWSTAFAAVARTHLARADAAASTASAIAHAREAAAWFHVATLVPGPNAFLCAAAADAAMARAITLSEPGAERIEGPGFTGWLRGPRNQVPILVIPGMDSAKEEFEDVCRALLDRGASVFSMDGPGQGALAAETAVRADYHKIVTQIADRLGAGRIGVLGMSLGGYYAAASAAREPRVAAAATVSGPFRLDWDALPPFVTETFTRRSGSETAARRFVSQVDLRELASRIAVPLLVIDGGLDIIPGVENGERLARLAPQGEYLSVPYGDHLLGNARADWLPYAADWITGHLKEEGTS